jgi:uncharacterized protein (TIGR03435 family)
MEALADVLSNFPGRTVLDGTGLTGKYDLKAMGGPRVSEHHRRIRRGLSPTSALLRAHC